MIAEAGMGDIERRREALGPFGFQWLCACALSPVLRFSTTVHLGAALAEITGRPVPDAEEHRALFQLDWFRQGSIPEATRIELMRRVEPRLAERLRQALFDLYAQTGATAPADLAPDQVMATTRARPAPPRRFQAGDAILMRFVTGAPFPWLRPAWLIAILRWLRLRTPRLRWIVLGVLGSLAAILAAQLVLPNVLTLQHAIDRMTSRQVTRRESIRVPEPPRPPPAAVKPKPAPPATQSPRPKVAPVSQPVFQPPVTPDESHAPPATEGERWGVVYSEASSDELSLPQPNFSSQGRELMIGDSRALYKIDIEANKSSSKARLPEGFADSFDNSFLTETPWLFGYVKNACANFNYITGDTVKISNCNIVEDDITNENETSKTSFPGIARDGSYIYTIRNHRLTKYDKDKMTYIGMVNIEFSQPPIIKTESSGKYLIISDRRVGHLVKMDGGIDGVISEICTLPPESDFSGNYITAPTPDQISIRDAQTGQVIGEFPVPGVAASAVSGDRLATVQHNGAVTLWSIITGKQVASLKSVALGDYKIVSMNFSPDGMRLAVIFGDGMRRNIIWVWQLQPAAAAPVQATLPPKQ